MKRIMRATLLTLVSLMVGPAFADFKIPPVANVGEGSLIEARQIFGIAKKPTKECHASTIVETPSGLVAAWFAGTHERHEDVGVWVSRQVDGSWTAPTEVVNGVQSQNKRYPCWNPVLFQPKEGPLLLFYKVGPSPSTWWGMLTTSHDGGKTWTWPTKLGHHESVGHLLGPVKNKPLQLSDGAILCPSSTEMDVKEGDDQWRVHFEVTRDQGKTWEVIGPINDGVEFDAIQPSILTHKNGDLQILCRSRQGVVTQSWSTDAGKTWREMTASGLPNPSAGTDALTLADGRHLIVYNHTTRKTLIPGRRMLNVAISDDGKDWKPVVTLERTPKSANSSRSVEYSYPAVIQSKDGKVHITYTYDREGIKHVVLDPAKL
ncbi:MAG: putative neuraminidase [Akkermansiaceae bacterium]|jgi:predicted neuraminidase